MNEGKPVIALTQLCKRLEVIFTNYYKEDVETEVSLVIDATGICLKATNVYNVTEIYLGNLEELEVTLKELIKACNTALNVCNNAIYTSITPNPTLLLED